MLLLTKAMLDFMSVIFLLCYAQGLEILKFTMTQPCLDLDTVTSHIGDMKV